MTKESYRSIGAITGLIVGMGLMYAFSPGGMISGFIFGAGGAVIGGICGEMIYAKRS